MEQQKSTLDPVHIQVLQMIADGDLDLRSGDTYSSIISDLFNLGLLVGSRYAPETLQLTAQGEDALNSQEKNSSDLVGITSEMIDRLRAIGTYGSMGLDVNDPDDDVSALLIGRGFVTPTGRSYPSDLGNYDVPIYRLSASGQQIIIDEASGGVFDKSVQKSIPLDTIHLRILWFIYDRDIHFGDCDRYSSVISDLFNLGLVTGSCDDPGTLQITERGADMLNDDLAQKMPATGGYGMSGDYSELLDWVSHLPFTAGFIIFNANDDPEGYSKAEQAVAYGLLIRRDNLIADEPQFSETMAYSLSIEGAMAAAGKSVKEKQKAVGNIPNIKAWEGSSGRYDPDADPEVQSVLSRMRQSDLNSLMDMEGKLPLESDFESGVLESLLRLGLIEREGTTGTPNGDKDFYSTTTLGNSVILWNRQHTYGKSAKQKTAKARPGEYGITEGNEEFDQTGFDLDTIELLRRLNPISYTPIPGAADHETLQNLEMLGYVSSRDSFSGIDEWRLTQDGIDALNRSKSSGPKTKSALPASSSPALQFLEQQKQKKDSSDLLPMEDDEGFGLEKSEIRVLYRLGDNGGQAILPQDIAVLQGLAEEGLAETVSSSNLGLWQLTDLGWNAYHHYDLIRYSL